MRANNGALVVWKSKGKRVRQQLAYASSRQQQQPMHLVDNNNNIPPIGRQRFFSGERNVEPATLGQWRDLYDAPEDLEARGRFFHALESQLNSNSDDDGGGVRRVLDLDREPGGFGVGDVHAGVVQPVFDLLRIVHFEDISAAEFHVGRLLTRFEEVDRECGRRLVGGRRCRRGGGLSGGGGGRAPGSTAGRAAASRSAHFVDAMFGRRAMMNGASEGPRRMSDETCKGKGKGIE